MQRLYRSTSYILIAAMTASTMPAMGQSGSLTCSSDDGGYRYCRADTQNQVRLVRQISGSPCRQGYSWGFDYRGIWVDRGCRAQFDYGSNNNSGSDNTGAAIAAGILGAIVIGSIVASQNDDNNDNNYSTHRDAYRDGYRRGQQDWDDGYDPNYARYRNRYGSQFQSDFTAGYDDGFYNRPNRYRGTMRAAMRFPFDLAKFALFIAVAGTTLGSHEAKAQATTPNSSQANAKVAPRLDADMLEQIEKSGKLRVGVSEIVPWAMHDKDGKLVGFSIDVAKKLARDLGVQVEFHPVEFHYLISDLLADRYDIIVSGFSVEPARALLVNFSNPYNSTDVTLAANKKTAGSYTTLQEFNKPTLTIGALEGSTAEEMAGKLLPEAQIKTYSSDSALFDDLTKGKLDAAAADYPRPEIVAKIFSDTISSPAGVRLSTFPSAFAVRRGDPDFVNFLNAWIASRTADEWLEGRRTYWFKSMDWAKNL